MKTTNKFDVIKQWLAWLVVVPTTVISLIGMLRVLVKLWQNRLPWVPTILPPDLKELEGLTDEEAASRRTYDPDEENKRARKKINRTLLQRNLVSIFNVSLLGLAIATFILGDWLGALTTLGVLIANIVVNTVQQVFAVQNVEKIASQSRPKVNAIRSGQSIGIRADEIVVGDVLVVGLGDQILADGLILRAADNLWVNNSAFAERGKLPNKMPGEMLKTGHYCVQGWAAYEVQSLPPEELRTPQLNTIPKTSADLTPLQKIIDHILRVLLVLTAFFVFILIQHILRWDIIPPDVQKTYRDMASIIFSIAPSGLFFMIIVSYNMGTFDLLKLGALVRDSRSVESLAQVTTLCFGKSGALTGIDIQVEMLPQPDEASTLGESRVRQIIGDFAHNSSSLSPFLTELRKAFEGQTRPVSNETRFLSTYGWSALNFFDPDLQGTYVLARPGFFQIEVLQENQEIEEDGHGEEQDFVVQKTLGRLRGLFKRNGAESKFEGEDETISEEGSQTGTRADITSQDDKAIEEDIPSIFQRIRKRITQAVQRETPLNEENLKPKNPSSNPPVSYWLTPQLSNRFTMRPAARPFQKT